MSADYIEFCFFKHIITLAYIFSYPVQVQLAELIK